MVPFRLPNAYSEDHFRNLAYTTAGGYQSSPNHNNGQYHSSHSSHNLQNENTSLSVSVVRVLASTTGGGGRGSEEGGTSGRNGGKNGGSGGGGIPLIGDWLPKMTDLFILSRLYAGAEGQANNWRPAKDISRLLTMSKFMELRERIEKHRVSSKLSSSTKPPLLRYAMLAVQKLCQQNPPLLQVSNLPPNAFNHFLMPPEDRTNNDFSRPAAETPDSPVLGFNNTKWALTEAGKRWVEERTPLQKNSKRKSTATPHRDRTSKQQKTTEVANFQLLPASDTKLPTTSPLFPIPLQPPLSSLPPLAQILRDAAADSESSSSSSSTHSGMGQQTQLVMMILGMQDRLDSMERLYRNLNDQHLDLQQRHESLKQEHEELRDKFSAAKQITQLQNHTLTLTK